MRGRPGIGEEQFFTSGVDRGRLPVRFREEALQHLDRGVVCSDDGLRIRQSRERFVALLGE